MSEVEIPDLAAYVTRRGFDLRSHSFGNGNYGIAAVEAGGKQQSPGLLHLDGFECPKRQKSRYPDEVSAFLCLPGLSFHYGLHCQVIDRSQPTALWLRSEINGFSHGLKTVHRTVFVPVCALVPPFRISSDHKIRTRYKCIWSLFGDPPGIRTPDPLLKRQLLCQLS